MNSAMSTQALRGKPNSTRGSSGAFVTRANERFYCINDVDEMPPFFISVISSDDHWLFVSSTGGLTAGRVSPETALFPYTTVDNIHESLRHTGPKTIIRVQQKDGPRYWEPFNRAHRGRYAISRNLYKSTLGDKLCFEEINHDLKLSFSYTWSTSAAHGFIRDCELHNTGSERTRVEIVDGLQNILPAGTPRNAQTNTSNLVDAYKWTELDEQSGLALLTLYSQITDRAEPSESLRATTAYCLGLDKPTVLVSNTQLDSFRDGQRLTQESHRRGIRGAYLVGHETQLAAGASSCWRIVLNTEQDQSEAVQLRQSLLDDSSLNMSISNSIAQGSKELAGIMGSADAFQATAEENVSVHHYANVLFNVLRGGIAADQYRVSAKDFGRTIRLFNQTVHERNQQLLNTLPEPIRADELIRIVREAGDQQLLRLTLEYLPITFGRRHGDPSRPWNQFAIELKDENGEDLLSYQGNWRDIFQNWEALAFSYPDFVESMIAKFVNASTLDGYNPYRITKEGIDWEVEEPDDPWSYIGYWGDHQIIYLLKLLELSRNFHPQKLQELLHEPVFCYANVPYRIKPLEQLLEDPKATVEFDENLAKVLDTRVTALGADGKLIQDSAGEVYQVNLLEKLIVPLLAKLGNLVIGGGIWLNTQRPEWNDANNALVGQGLSMVTLYYMRRYVKFLAVLLEGTSGTFSITEEVDIWLGDTAAALVELRAELNGNPDMNKLRAQSLNALGGAAARFRERVYKQDHIDGVCERNLSSVHDMLSDALSIIDHSIARNKRSDGLYHTYNIADFSQQRVSVDNLYPMLEGQVAALSAGTVAPEEAAHIIEALFNSSIYRADQNSFMLYPDRELPGFLERNCLPEHKVQSIELLQNMLERGDKRIVLRDATGKLRFNADFKNESDLRAALIDLGGADATALSTDLQAIVDLYEEVFLHSQFTGRSGTMFGFEGLGSIYWHMVSKLLLAISESYFDALANNASAAALQRLGELYYRVRSGLSFNKSPEEYGAFPTDPYSHTPKHSGARQPGMTGQVKEEILTRFAELGIQVKEGIASIRPSLLQAREFTQSAQQFWYTNTDDEWTVAELPENSLAFTWCQVLFVYRLGDASTARLTVELADGTEVVHPNFSLPAASSADLFARNGQIRKVTAIIDRATLFSPS